MMNLSYPSSKIRIVPVGDKRDGMLGTYFHVQLPKPQFKAFPYHMGKIRSQETSWASLGAVMGCVSVALLLLG